MDDTTRAVPVLGYGGPPAGRGRPLAQVVAAAVVCQGGGSAAVLLWQIGDAVRGRGKGMTASTADKTMLALGAATACVYMALVPAGLLASKGRSAGRVAVLLVEATVAGLRVLGTGLFILQYARPPRYSWAVWDAVRSVLETASALVMPALVWALFRRPEVRATFDAAEAESAAPVRP